MGPLWSSTSSHNVGLSAATVHRATPPLNPQQGNDWETRGPNKCPFVTRAWKLWSQHKLILVSEVVQTIIWILSQWNSLSRVSRGDGDKSDKDLVSLGQSVMAEGHFVSATVFVGVYPWKGYGSSSQMCHFSCHIKWNNMIEIKLKYWQLLYQVHICACNCLIIKPLIQHKTYLDVQL